MRYIDNDILCAVGDSIVGRTRAANEDSCGYRIIPDGFLFVVCDGMGGHVGGAVASGIAVDSILEYLGRSKHEDVPAAINAALEYANIQILGRAKENPELSGMGTTACVLLIANGKAWIAHVGDSRIYLYSKKNGTLHRITKDHSFVQGLVDTGQLDDRDAENHPRKNVILKALGLRNDLVPDVCREPVMPAKDDMFLICSDGLSGMIDDDAIEQILKEDYDLEGMLGVLIDDANEPGKGKDNITAQLIKVKASESPVSSFPDYNPNWRRVKIQEKTVGQGIVCTGDYDASRRKFKSSGWMKYLWISAVAVIIGIMLAVICRPDKKEQPIDKGNEELADSIKERKEEIRSLENELKHLDSKIEEVSRNEADPVFRDYIDSLKQESEKIKVARKDAERQLDSLSSLSQKVVSEQLESEAPRSKRKSTSNMKRI